MPSPAVPRSPAPCRLVEADSGWCATVRVSQPEQAELFAAKGWGTTVGGRLEGSRHHDAARGLVPAIEMSPAPVYKAGAKAEGCSRLGRAAMSAPVARRRRRCVYARRRHAEQTSCKQALSRTMGSVQHGKLLCYVGAHCRDRRDADAPGLDDGVGALQQQGADGAGVIRLSAQPIMPLGRHWPFAGDYYVVTQCRFSTFLSMLHN